MRFRSSFVFGDSNSDTGGYFAAFPGRMSDGRLIVDFLAQALGLPFLSPYLQSLDSDFRHGVNFAVASAGVCLTSDQGGSPFTLIVQLNQFKQFKQKVDQSNSSGTPLPEPDIFGKSLFIIYIGQNDFTFSFGSRGLTDDDFLHKVVLGITNTIKEVYEMGGRTILVFNLAPVGCYPYMLSQSRNASDIDSSGCLMSCNNAVDNYNGMLKAELDKVRQQIPIDAKLILVDTHAVLLQIFRNPTAYGFENATGACYNAGVSFCEDSNKYVNWDRIHLTEATNKVVADALLLSNGSYFDPPFSILG